MESELRRWWRDRGDYLWLVEFLRPRGVLPVLKTIVGAGGLVMALAALCLLRERLIAPSALAHTVVLGIVVAAIGWTAYWWLLPWPSPRTSLALIGGADLGVVVATVVHANPLAALTTTPLFAMTGAYVVFFHGPRANVTHVTVAALTIVGSAASLASSDQPDAVALAISKALVAFTVTAGILPFMQFGFWLVRNNSVEALTDPLTQLANRRGLAQHVARIGTRASAGSTDPLWAFVIDLDSFKEVNDRYGHTVGDTVITRTADLIRASVHRSALVARIGGEEFVVVDRLAVSAATALAERIRTAVATSDPPRVTASIGVVACTATMTAAADFERLYLYADEAMYTAKRRGGNQVAYATCDE